MNRQPNDHECVVVLRNRHGEVVGRVRELRWDQQPGIVVRGTSYYTLDQVNADGSVAHYTEARVHFFS